MMKLMFEHHKAPLATRPIFLRRLGRSVAVGLGIVLVSLGAGMIGYHFIEGISWVDAFEEAAMILSGMGPTVPMQSFAGKFFAGCYALYSGLILILTIGLMVAPIVHRFFHKFHLNVDEGN